MTLDVKLCECGCGQPAPIAKRTRTGLGHVKGQPIRVIRGHATGRYEADRSLAAEKDLQCRRRYKAESKVRMRAYVAEYLATHPCVDCGETDPIVLDFHHRNPAEKYRSVSRIIANALGFEVMKKEIEKCDVLCANDHRRRHFKESH